PTPPAADTTSGSIAASRSTDCTRCPRCGARSGHSCTSSVRVQGHREEEGRTLAELAFHPDASPVQLDEPLRDAEPEAGAAIFLGDRCVDLPTLREYVLD